MDCTVKFFLIVEDNDFDYEQLVSVLKDRFGENMVIIRATTIPEAAQRVQLLFARTDVYQPGCIFVDMQLPEASLGFDGYYLIGYFSEQMLNNELPFVPIVAISSDMNEQRVRRSETAGAAMTIEKPLTAEHLETLLELQLHDHEHRVETIQRGFTDLASDVVGKIKHRFGQSSDILNDTDIRVLLTALSPALHFASQGQRAQSIVIIRRLGGTGRVRNVVEEYRIALKRGAIPMDQEDYVRDEIEKMVGMLIHGVTQKAILERFDYGRTRYETRIKQIVASLRYFINHHLDSK